MADVAYVLLTAAFFVAVALVARRAAAHDPERGGGAR